MDTTPIKLAQSAYQSLPQMWQDRMNKLPVFDIIGKFIDTLIFAILPKQNQTLNLALLPF